VPPRAPVTPCIWVYYCLMGLRYFFLLIFCEWSYRRRTDM